MICFSLLCFVWLVCWCFLFVLFWFVVFEVSILENVPSAGGMFY